MYDYALCYAVLQQIGFLIPSEDEMLQLLEADDPFNRKDEHLNLRKGLEITFKEYLSQCQTQRKEIKEKEKEKESGRVDQWHMKIRRFVEKRKKKKKEEKTNFEGLEKWERW